VEAEREEGFAAEMENRGGWGAKKLLNDVLADGRRALGKGEENTLIGTFRGRLRQWGGGVHI